MQRLQNRIFPAKSVIVELCPENQASLGAIRLQRSALGGADSWCWCSLCRRTSNLCSGCKLWRRDWCGRSIYVDNAGLHRRRRYVVIRSRASRAKLAVRSSSMRPTCSTNITSRSCSSVIQCGLGQSRRVLRRCHTSGEPSQSNGRWAKQVRHRLELRCNRPTGYPEGAFAGAPLIVPSPGLRPRRCEVKECGSCSWLTSLNRSDDRGFHRDEWPDRCSDPMGS